jgi:hypothetical protein
MHTQKSTRTGKVRIPPIIDRSVEEEILLKRWEESDREFVEEELDWDDPLDAALGVELAGFRPGIDQYDA